MSSHQLKHLERRKPIPDAGSGRIFNSAMQDAICGSDCNVPDDKTEKKYSVLSNQSKENILSQNEFDAVTTETEVEKSHDSGEIYTSDSSPKTSKDEFSAFCEDSIYAKFQNELNEYKLPLTSDNHNLLDSTNDDNLNIKPLIHSNAIDIVPCSSQSNMAFVENHSNQNICPAPKVTEYVQYFRSKNLNHDPSKPENSSSQSATNFSIPSPVSRCKIQSSTPPQQEGATNFSIPSPVSRYKIQRTSQHESKDKSLGDSSDSGYLSFSQGSPSSNCNLDSLTKSTHLELQPKRPYSPILPPEPDESPFKRKFFKSFSEGSKVLHSPDERYRNSFRRSLDSNTSRTYIQAHRRSRSDLVSPVTSLSSTLSTYKIDRTPSHSYNRICATDQSPYSPSPYQQDRKRLRTGLPQYMSWNLNNFKSDVGFIDSHCHLDFLFQREDFSGTFAEYREQHRDSFPRSFKGCVAVFCNPFTFKGTMWKDFLEESNIWAAIGCHPHNSKDYNEEIDEALINALKHPRVKALGEIGLDYSSRNNCQKETQHKVFKRQLNLAVERQLPIVIHCREAHTDGLSIVQEIVPRDHLVHLHCFTDKWHWAQRWLEAFPNLFIGLTNLVTYPSADDVHEVARNLPLDRLLLETDAPYFVPRVISKDNRLSHPGMAIHVAAQIAAIKDHIPLDDVLRAVKLNTKKMYGIE